MKYTAILILFVVLLGTLSARRRRKGGISESGKQISDEEWGALKEKFAKISNSVNLGKAAAHNFSDHFDYGLIELSRPSEPRSINVIPSQSIEETSRPFKNPHVWFGYFSLPEENIFELRLYFVDHSGHSQDSNPSLRQISKGEKENILALYINKPNLETITAVISLASVFTHFIEITQADYQFIAEKTEGSAILPGLSNSDQLMYDSIYLYGKESNPSPVAKCNIFAYQQGMYGFVKQKIEESTQTNFNETKIKLRALFGKNLENIEKQSKDEKIAEHCQTLLIEHFSKDAASYKNLPIAHNKH